MIVSKSLNAEMLKVCTYKLDHTCAVLPAAAQGVDQSVSMGCLPEYQLGLFSTASTLPPRTVSESL
jgi:hypothetical protein